MNVFLNKIDMALFIEMIKRKRVLEKKHYGMTGKGRG